LIWQWVSVGRATAYSQGRAGKMEIAIESEYACIHVGQARTPMIFILVRRFGAANAGRSDFGAPDLNSQI